MYRGIQLSILTPGVRILVPITIHNYFLPRGLYDGDSELKPYCNIKPYKIVNPSNSPCDAYVPSWIHTLQCMPEMRFPLARFILKEPLPR